MPIYEYVCMNCDHHFDALRAMQDADAPIECTQCHSDQTQRQISLFAAHSEGRLLAGNDTSCSTCRTHSCSTCNSKPT
jgi:putative FmdB family regulatory protein